MRQVLFIGALLTTALAQIDIVEIHRKIPACAQKCSTQVLAEAQCSLNDLANCLCSDNEVQKALAICVIETCSLEDQYTSTTILQNDICKGTPQPSRSHEIRVIMYILAGVTLPIVVLRFVSRWVVARKFWWDDYTMLLAVIFMIPLTALPIINSKQGFGRHFWTVQAQYIPPLRISWYATQLLYTAVVTITKCSMLLLYLRIFITPRFQIMVKICMGSVLFYGLVYILCLAFQCIPVNSIWTTGPGSARCLDSQALIFSGAGVSIIEDFLIMLLPIIELKKLNLSLKRKISLGFMFAVGSFACITSIVRLKYITLYSLSLDLTWDNIDTIIWSEIELFVSIICACLICLRPLIIMILPKSLQSKQSGKERLSGEESLVNHKREMSTQVTITQSASVESKVIEPKDLETAADRDTFTHGFVGKTVIEAQPQYIHD